MVPSNDLPECGSIGTLSIVEGSAAGTSVGVIAGAGKIRDEDTQNLFLEISSGDVDGMFTIATGVTSFDGSASIVTTGVATDYESQAEYSVSIRVTEDSAAENYIDCVGIVINVQDANEPTVFPNVVRTVKECTGAACPADHMSGQQSESTDPDTGEVTTALPAIQASDPDLVDIDLAGGVTGTYSLVEDTSPFDIDGTTGQLVLKAGEYLDYEATPQYTVTVRWTSDNTWPAGPNTGPFDATLTINIENVEEVPVIADQTFSMAENYVGEIGTLAVSDPDYPDASVCADAGHGCGLRYALSGTDAFMFSVNELTGVISSTSDNTNFEIAGSHTLRFTATDDNGLGRNDAKLITINVQDEDDCAVSSIYYGGGTDAAVFLTEGNEAIKIVGTEPQLKRCALRTATNTTILPIRAQATTCSPLPRASPPMAPSRTPTSKWRSRSSTARTRALLALTSSLAAPSTGRTAARTP
jgi:hypothetical protein